MRHCLKTFHKKLLDKKAGIIHTLIDGGIMKKALFYLTIFIFLTNLACSSLNSPTKIVSLNSQIESKESGFKSPEDLVEYFVQCIRNGNFGDTLKTSVYYYDENISKIDSKARVKQVNAISMSMSLNLPKQYNELIKIRSLSSHCLNIELLITSILLPERYSEYLEVKPFLFDGDDDLLDFYFYSMADVEKLKTFEFIKLVKYGEEFQSSENYKEYVKKQKSVYGFDDMADYIVLYKCNNTYYVGGFVFVSYNNNWYVFSYSSTISGTSVLGTLEEISGEEEFMYKRIYE
jgi:hypothetical protein